METIKKYIKSPYMIILIFSIKLIVYYNLINVNLTKNLMVMSSIFVLGALFLGLSYSKLKHKKLYFLLSYAFVSIIMFADTMYFNYYNQTVSVKQIWQAANVAAVPSSFIATLIPASFILVLDIPFVLYYFIKTSKNYVQSINHKVIRTAMMSVGVFLLLFSINPISSTAIERVNSVEFFTNHFNDIFQTVAEQLKVNDISAQEVYQTVEEIKEEPDGNRLAGIGNGKNLIVIQMESMQDFVIGKSYNGQVLTPNLNKLLQKDSIYFENYYANIGKGNTADAEFSTLNSLYPVIDGESYRLFVENTYNGLPWIMRDNGYSAFAVHGYEETFWNRSEAYPNQGFEDYISMEDLDSSEKIGLGISDKSMFKQLMPILEEQKKPFFSFVITLTNHHPYLIDENQASLKLLEQDENTKFGNYLQTVRYTDEAIGQFIEDLKAEGLYDNTVIALYGDHHGLSCTMEENKEQMEGFLGESYDFDEMFHIPFIIHVPNSGVNSTVKTLGGQIDFLPTITNIMGLENKNPYVLGQDLVNAKEGFVAFTAYLFEGSFAKNGVMFEISREGVFEGSRAWEIGTGKELDYSAYEEDHDKAIKLKKTSKEILEQNLIKEYITH